MEIVIKNQNNITDLGLEGNTSPNELTIQKSKVRSVQIINLKPATFYFSGTQFYSCRFTKATFSDGVIDRCVFKDCDLQNIDFNHTTFTNCEFINCKLSQSEFRYTKIRKATFNNV